MWLFTLTETEPDGVKLEVVPPPVEARAYVPDLPIAKRPAKFGTLKVLDPSPAPYVFAISAYKVLYVERETAAPSQFK